MSAPDDIVLILALSALRAEVEAGRTAAGRRLGADALFARQGALERLEAMRRALGSGRRASHPGPYIADAPKA